MIINSTFIMASVFKRQYKIAMFLWNNPLKAHWNVSWMMWYHHTSMLTCLILHSRSVNVKRPVTHPPLPHIVSHSQLPSHRSTDRLKWTTHTSVQCYTQTCFQLASSLNVICCCQLLHLLSVSSSEWRLCLHPLMRWFRGMQECD